ncbi:MAG: bifunctional methylenetetrahydrofolate dehydrogenase/methenyltetrahydrofolate cyclohydrolase, partial [Lachnospiraceae bacterium]|nr:bifunctional methylenetetrahydrofolate dehydrogenase/methenyltetrahydrofolate cyclohydrolase [Lachnospiraceae bacterium]
IGNESLAYELQKDTTQQEILHLVQKLNAEDRVNGILVKIPLTGQIDEGKVIQTIAPEKDVDGFHEKNVGALCVGSRGYVSCTPLGIIQLLKRSGVEIAGKHCVVIGRSNIVGKPMALLLLRENGTVTVCHSRTQDLREITRQADILVAAVGKPKFVDDSYIKEGAVVIDVGIHRDENNKLCGDVDFDKVAPHTSAITPVPGGVGPMTIAMLMYNCVSSVE